MKNKLPALLKSCVVYCIPCSYMYDGFYIGETVTRLETRKKEHKDTSRKELQKNQPLLRIHGIVITQMHGRRWQ